MENTKLHGRDLTAAELVRLMDEYVNSHGDSDFAKVAEEVTTRVHRTLQQKLMGLFVAVIASWAAKTEHQYDLRNEATVKLAKRIIEATGDKYDRHLPCI